MQLGKAKGGVTVYGNDDLYFSPWSPGEGGKDVGLCLGFRGGREGGRGGGRESYRSRVLPGFCRQLGKSGGDCGVGDLKERRR